MYLNVKKGDFERETEREELWKAEKAHGTKDSFLLRLRGGGHL